MLPAANFGPKKLYLFRLICTFVHTIQVMLILKQNDTQ